MLTRPADGGCARVVRVRIVVVSAIIDTAMRATHIQKTGFLFAIGACTALLAWNSFLDPNKPWPINLAIACLGLFVVVGVPLIVAVAVRESWTTKSDDRPDATNPAWWVFAYLFEVATFLVVLVSVLSD